jgi:hypothetical protein
MGAGGEGEGRGCARPCSVHAISQGPAHGAHRGTPRPILHLPTYTRTLHPLPLQALLGDAGLALDPRSRTADAARGCLLQLGELGDAAAEAALHTTGQPPHPSPAAAAGGPSGAAGGGTDGGGGPRQYQYDVFLSHKRSDSKDFARALYTLLTLQGVKTFLDFVGSGGGGRGRG